MLGLAEQVGGDELRVGGLVGDHGDLRRAGEQVDPHPAEQLPLGLGDVGVAGADDHVDGRLAEQPEGHGGERLHAAEGEDPVGAGEVGAVEHGGVRAVPPDGGVQARTVGTPAALATPTVMNALASSGNRPGGQVGADAGDRDVLHPPRNAGRELDLEVGETLALREREADGCARSRARGPHGRRRAARRRSSSGRRRTPPASPDHPSSSLAYARTASSPSRSMFRKHLGDPFDDLGVALRGRPVDCGPLQPGERAKCAGFVGGDLHDRRR